MRILVILNVVRIASIFVEYVTSITRAGGNMRDANLKFSKYLYPNSMASAVLLASNAIKNSFMRTEKGEEMH
jgi:hypothetical protein